jgi:hypothetical protein
MKQYTYDELWWMQEAMITEGGSFVSTLGSLWRRADSTNSNRLLLAFPEYVEEYVGLGKSLSERRNEQQ